MAERPHPQIEVLAFGGHGARGNSHDGPAGNDAQEAHGVAERIFALARPGDASRGPGEPYADERDAHAEQASTALEPDEETDGGHEEPWSANGERRRLDSRARPLAALAVERTDGQATERHRQPRHRADVAEDRARLDEVDGHRGEDDGRVGAGPAIEQARDEGVRGQDAEQPPEGQRKSAGPLVQAEELEAERDRRERELRSPEVVKVRQRVVRPLEREVARVVEVERDAAREVRDVQLVGIPEAAPRQRRQHEEEERGDGRRHRERRPLPPGPCGLGRPVRRGRGALDWLFFASRFRARSRRSRVFRHGRGTLLPRSAAAQPRLSC